MTRPDPIKTREHWETLADGYDEAKRRNGAYYETLKGLFDGWLPGDHRGRILELGCGTGQILAHLRPQAGLGVDASAKMIDNASRRFADRDELSFRVMDVMDAAKAEALGPVDAVVTADLLEHVPDWRGVVRVAAAACRESGTIVISTPNPLWAAPLWILERLRLKMPEGPHEFVPKRAIAVALRDAGCAIVHVGTHLAVPADLAGAGPRLSVAVEGWPGLRHLGVIQLVVARGARGSGP